jgi:hypothetical protein
MTATDARGVRALLADGRIVLIRAIEPADAPAVLDLHTRLSEQDKYLRFFGSGSATTLDRGSLRRGSPFSGCDSLGASCQRG